MRRNSESGYSSDECQIRSPSNILIKKDARKFARNYTVVDEIMKSANGVIYRGVDLKTRHHVVIKQIPRNVIRQYFNVNGRMCPSEIYYHFLAFEKSPNFVAKPLAWFEKRSSFVLVMENFENSTDIFELSKKYGQINEEAAKVIFHQIVKCSKELLSAGIVHRDLKDENVLVNPQTLEIKLIDFGCATRVKSTYKSSSGTFQYFPPEWFSHQEYEPEALTVWSLGSILYILLTGEWNFENGKFNRNFRKERHLSNSVKSLIDSILCNFPTKRANLETILKSDWLKNIL